MAPSDELHNYNSNHYQFLGQDQPKPKPKKYCTGVIKTKPSQIPKSVRPGDDDISQPYSNNNNKTY